MNRMEYKRLGRKPKMARIEHIRRLEAGEFAEFLAKTFCHGYGESGIEAWLLQEVERANE